MENMDPFTKEILEKAEKRSRIHGISNASELKLSKFEQLDSFSNEATVTSINLDGDSKSTSPSKIRRQFSVDKENLDVGIEINITTKPNVEVQVGIEEEEEQQSDNEEKMSDKPIRDSSRNRLQRLCALYSDVGDLSSPIHKTENKFFEENTEKQSETVLSAKPKRNVGKLAALANSIKSWEDDTSHPDYKCVEHKKQQPCDTHQKQLTSSSGNKPLQEQKSNQRSDSSKNIKQLKWDKSVIDSLEAQGFQRRESSTTKLSYDYGKKNVTGSSSNANTKHITAQVHSQQQTPSEISSNQSISDIKTPEIKPGLVSSKTAVFETQLKKSALNEKDPAEMSLKERMMFFERNKGKVPLPKTTFALPRTPVPSKSIKTGNTATVVGVEPKKFDTPSKSDIKDFPVNQVKLKDKVAALFAGPSTISEAQIKANRTKQLQEEMNVLENRFVRKNQNAEETQQCQYHEVSDDNKEIMRPPPTPPPMPFFDCSANGGSSASQTHEHVDAKCTLLKNKRRSPGVVISEKTDSSMKNSSDDAKRIKVNPSNNAKNNKTQCLYPLLYDLESIESDNGNCTTATMSIPSIDEHEGHNKFDDDAIHATDEAEETDENDESYIDSDRDDDIDISLGREIMHLVHSNNAQESRMNYHHGSGDVSMNNSSAATSIASTNGLEDYLDEALDEDEEDDEMEYSAPTNSKNKNNGTTSSNSFCYQKQYLQQQQQPQKNLDHRTPLKSELTVNSDDNNVVTLVHTVSFYRRQQSSNSNNSTPVRKIYREQATTSQQQYYPNVNNDNDNYEHDDSSSTSSNDHREEQHLVQEKIKRLLVEVVKQQQIMAQTSQALNLCASTIEFSGSTEAVEGERHLLVATHRRQSALDEIQRLKIEGTLRPIGSPKEKGRLSVKEITVPLKDDYIKKLSTDTISGHHLVCLLKYGEIVLATKTVPTLPGLVSVKFPDILTLNNVYADFKITLEIYGMTAQREVLPHEVKYHINLNNKKTPKKKGHGSSDSMLIMPRVQSPAGPNVIRTPALVQYGYAIFSLREIQRDTWTLTPVSGVSPLKGVVQMKINCELSVNVVFKGFLTMFEDISGFGAWHRRWCYLNGHVLNYWKYPDDEKKKTPMGSIDLHTCCSTKITTAPRDICARLNTLLLECERPAKDNDIESLIIVPKGKKTIVRYLLSADTKQERDEWSAHFNKALTLLRAWNSTSTTSSTSSLYSF